MKTTSLSVNDDPTDTLRIRGRSERASSLALPHSSLLDFYDKQQEQCQSVALLPTNINVVVRRHSSHYYPMLEEQQQQQEQQQQPHQQLSQPQKLLTTLSKTNRGGGEGAKAATTSFSTLSGSPSNPMTTSAASPGSHALQFNFSNKATAATTTNQLLLVEDMSTTTAMMSSVVNFNDSKYHLETPAINTPPPIPKRTFRGNSIRNSKTSPAPKSQRETISHSPGNKRHICQQQQQQQQLAYFQNPNVEPVQNLYVDLSTRQLYSSDGGSLDAGASSDDDRISLENSVFDESSVNSTPVKSANAAKSAGGFIGLLAGKTLAAFSNDLSSAAKRANRSSSSTVDSSITASSGYGSHSERLASTSTADFRSRFSSVDTQSSLDSCLTEKTTDLSLSKESFKFERSFLQDNMTTEYNNQLNNNEMRTSIIANVNSISPNSNNNSPGRKSTNCKMNASTFSNQKLPAVPMRKQYSVPPKIPPSTLSPATITTTNTSQHSLSNVSKTSSVSASTSTSSAASGISYGSYMSLSTATGGNASSSPVSQDQKRPVPPPAPPSRTQNSFDHSSGSMFNGNNTSETDAAGSRGPPPLTIRNKLSKNRPPPIVYPKPHQRQDSNLSSDGFSVSSSPGYNCKNLMEAPLLSNAARINQSGPGKAIQQQDANTGDNMSAFRVGLPVSPPRSGKDNYRQDSTISIDSFSQNSSPGYNTKLMEAPLLPLVKHMCSVPSPTVFKQKIQDSSIDETPQAVSMSPLTKCVSTPASLQTIVRYQNGAPNTMSLQHQIINRRKSSNPYITNGRLNFRFYQVLVNIFALLAIAGSLAVFFSAYPVQVKVVNQTIINTIRVEEVVGYGKNPAPGTCLPIIVKFCEGPQIPYNFTVFPNYIGHFGQLETQVDLDAYEALVDVRCYDLVSLFLCTLFVPKCGATGSTVPPCKTLCTETMRRCGFFFDVFGLSLPEYLNCNLFKDFESSEECVGLEQVRNVMMAASNPVCNGFQCDQARCIPNDYVCDGHLDCMDQTDESNCDRCDADAIYCGEDRCMSSKHICDGIIDCPYGQDERNCIRLSDRNGDLGKGVLEVFHIDTHEWSPACVKNWDRSMSPTAVCSMLGYKAVNATSVVTQRTHRPLLTSVNVSTHIWKMYAKKRSNLMQEFANCKPEEDYPIAELTCTNYECGKVKRRRHKPSSRIIGGSQANPGSWPFLAAILGGPEKIFYCAGVLISDEWVLTASHCIGNHTVIDLEDWTIQLGVTRRNSFTYSGQKVKVKTVIPHPLYNTQIAHDNDIALFQLARRVSFNEHLLPVCLPPPGLKQIKPDTLCTVIGWGKREDNDPKATYESIVNEVEVPVIRRQQCDEWLDNLTVSDGMICAGFEEGGKDACQGDSGGPLLCPYPGEKDKWFVGGIVSWGIRCAHPKLPGVYANVLKYTPWIHEQIQKHTKPSREEGRISKFHYVPAGGAASTLNISPGASPFKNAYNNNNNSGKLFSSNSNQNRSPMDVDYYMNYGKS